MFCQYPDSDNLMNGEVCMHSCHMHMPNFTCVYSAHRSREGNISDAVEDTRFCLEKLRRDHAKWVKYFYCDINSTLINLSACTRGLQYLVCVCGVCVCLSVCLFGRFLLVHQINCPKRDTIRINTLWEIFLKDFRCVKCKYQYCPDCIKLPPCIRKGIGVGRGLGPPHILGGGPGPPNNYPSSCDNVGQSCVCIIGFCTTIRIENVCPITLI